MLTKQMETEIDAIMEAAESPLNQFRARFDTYIHSEIVKLGYPRSYEDARIDEILFELRKVFNKIYGLEDKVIESFKLLEDSCTGTPIKYVYLEDGSLSVEENKDTE